MKCCQYLREHWIPREMGKYPSCKGPCRKIRPISCQSTFDSFTQFPCSSRSFQGELLPLKVLMWKHPSLFVEAEKTLLDFCWRGQGPEEHKQVLMFYCKYMYRCHIQVWISHNHALLFSVYGKCPRSYNTVWSYITSSLWVGHEMHSQKKIKTLKLCWLSTYTDIFVFPLTPLLEVLPWFYVSYLHTIKAITLFLCTLCYACRSRYVLYLLSYFFSAECWLRIIHSGVSYVFWECRLPGNFSGRVWHVQYSRLVITWIHKLRCECELIGIELSIIPGTRVNIVIE